MNVLFVAEYYFANPPLVQISKELAKRKHNISVATSFRPMDWKAFDTVTIYEIKPFVSIYKIPHTLSFPLLKLRQIIKDQEIKVIHILNDGSTNAATVALLAKALNKPLVYTIQGPGTRTGHLLVDTLASAYGWTASRWLIREARKVILLSKGLIPTAEKFRVEKSKIAIIPSGVDSARFNPECPEVKEKASRLKEKLNIGDEIIIGYVGRLYPAKGLTYLFSAVKEIADKHPRIALLIIGDGAQRYELETMAKDLKIKTIFAGWQHDVLPYYSLMDIFVLPSLFEGLPNVILEAMAMKKAVVATRVGGNPDVLSNGVNGFLVPVRDVSQLAVALEKLIEDDELRIRMGAVNRQKVEKHFLWSKTVDRVEKIYSEIV